MMPVGTILRWIIAVAVATGFFICPCAHGEKVDSAASAGASTGASHHCCAGTSDPTAPAPANDSHEDSCPHCGQQLANAATAELSKQSPDAAPLLAISELLFAPIVPQSIGGDVTILAAPPNPPQQSVLCVFLI